MKSLPKNEKRRLEVLWRYDVLDTPSEEAFDTLAGLAAEICDVPMATITFIDENRQWFKAKVGLTDSETSREISFCAHAILSSELLVVPDATKDPRFAENPLVTGEPKIRFYAGAPLITADGYALGTICAIDTVARKLTASQLRSLETLSKHVVALLELRRQAIEAGKLSEDRELAKSKYQRIFENTFEAMFRTSPEGRYLDANPALARMLGYDSPEEVLANLRDISQQLFVDPDQRKVFKELLESNDSVDDFQTQFFRKDGSIIWVKTKARVVRDSTGKALYYEGSSQDITERKRIASALSETEEMFHLISENVSDLIVVIDETGHRLYNSPSHKQIFGDVKLLKGADAFENIHPEDRQATRDAFANALRTGVAKRIEYRFLLPDGTIRHIESQGNFVRSKTPNSGKMVVVSRDISERKQAEQRHAALSRLGQNLSAAASPIEAARVIGETTRELFGWDFFTLDLYSTGTDTINPILNIDTIKGEFVEVSKFIAVGPPSPLARRIIQTGAELILKEPPLIMLSDAKPRGDTSRPSASLMFVPVRNGTAVIGILSIQSYTLKAYSQQDLRELQTIADHCGGALERIRAEEALRTSEARFHSVWENSVDGMRLTDENGLIVAVNEAFCKLANMERSEVIGKPFTIAYAAPENDGELLQKYQQRFRNRTIAKFIDRRMTFLSGKTADLEVANSFVDLEGQKPLLLGLFRDVTEQKRLENQLRQSQKMESIGQLAGGIAHDFNNLLTVIQGHASLLLATERKGEVADSLQQISIAAERSANLTRQLLTFSRRQIMQRRSLDFKEVVDEMAKMLRRILGEDIVLKVENNSDLPRIQADRGMMEQILLNLAVNSRDAMPHGGELVITTSAVRTNEADTRANAEAYIGEFLCLKVSDNGCGIPPENMVHIFEPFFTTKEVGKGTGLGLATVYGIVKQHDGWIEVASEVGKGTEFKIFIPRDTEPSESPGQSSQQKAPTGTETILVVEDETPLRQLVQFILERQGYRVLEAASGVAALKVWEENKQHIDLLFTDLVMPEGMNGSELSIRLQAEKPQLKIIFTSGYSADTVGKDFVLRDGLDFLQKPYHPDKLAQTIRDCLDGK